MNRLVRLIQGLMRRLLFAYFRIDIRGLEHIPAQGGAILAANHPSLLDGILLQAVSPRRVRFLVAEEMYTHRYLHGLLKAFGCIPIYRTKGSNGDALRAAIAGLEQGDVVGIFPEGTIVDGGMMRRLKRGVALLARRTGVPVVPVGISGAREAFPDGARVPRPGAICLHFGEPLSFPKAEGPHLKEEEVTEVLARLQRRVVDLLHIPLAAEKRPLPARWAREWQVALAALLVCPLSSALMATANPSLDPARRQPEQG